MILSQNTVNVTPEQAAQYGCDMFQLYYPGTKIAFTVSKGTWSMTEGAKVLKHGEGDARWTGFMLGTFNSLNERVAFFDCWQCGDVDVQASPYRDRIMLLRTMVPYFFDWCSMANSYKIADFAHVWAEKVETGLFPGVIFRKSKDPATSPRLMCIKNPGTAGEIGLPKPS